MSARPSPQTIFRSLVAPRILLSQGGCRWRGCVLLAFLLAGIPVALNAQIDVTLPIPTPPPSTDEAVDDGPPAVAPFTDEALVEELLSGNAPLIIPDIDLVDGWIELTPLDRPTDRPILLELPKRTFGEGELEVKPGLEDGQYMVCSGGQTWAITCEGFYIDATQTLAFIRFEGGYRLTGSYDIAGLPVADARVALIPAELESERPFTMPLHRDGRLLVREVTTDEDGQFSIPAIAAGAYRLETLLPTGRVHRDTFEIPSLPRVLPPPEATPEDVQRLETEARLLAPSLPLGRISLFEGLSTEIRALDEVGLPVPRAEVIATEGLRPRDLVSFQALTDADGIARISGFTADRPVRVRCQREGFKPVELEFELVPALIECSIERYASLRGEVLGIDGAPPTGGTLALDTVRVADDEDDAPEDEAPGDEPRGVVRKALLDASGHFQIHQLEPGMYRLTAAAPGYAIVEETFELEAGQALDLGTLILSAAGQLRGQVVDAETQEPLSGIVIEGISPPGSASAVSDADGEFRVTFPGVDTMVLRLGGFEYAMREVRVTADQSRSLAPLVIGLHRGGWIQVQVLNGSQIPCQGCQVVIQPIGEVLTTDQRGEAVSGALQEANYRIERPRWHHLGSTVVEQPGAESKTVRVHAGQTTRVTLGRRARRALIRFAPSPGPQWTLSLQSGSHSESFFPTASGEFLVNIPDHGHSPGLAPRPNIFLHAWNEGSKAEHRIWQGEIDPNASIVTLPLPRTRVRVQLLSGGRPLAYQDVQIRRLADRVVAGQVRSDDDGWLHIDHLPVGMYTLALGNRPLTFVSVLAGQTVNLGRLEVPAHSF